jgi:hypothetical protein
MDELERINRMDRTETQSIRRLSAGILEKRPWVWLRWSRVSGTWTLVPQISLEGAYELYRRYIKDAHFFLEKVNSFTTPKGTPVISVIVSLTREKPRPGALKDDPYAISYETVAFGGQDGFITQTTETEERKLHGTAAALHKAIRNCILNYLLLHHGADVLYEFVNEAIRLGRAAIIERDGSYRFVTPEELSGRPQGDMVIEEEPVVAPKPQQRERETEHKPEVLKELSSIPPDTLNQWLLIYSEIVQKDPHSFSESEWTDFVKWTRMPISQREVEDLVQQATALYRREMGLPAAAPVDRRDIFRYIARNFLERGQRITELTQPQYHALKQKIQNELWKSMQVMSPEEEIIGEEGEFGEEETTDLDEFPF